MSSRTPSSVRRWLSTMLVGVGGIVVAGYVLAPKCGDERPDEGTGGDTFRDADEEPEHDADQGAVRGDGDVDVDSDGDLDIENDGDRDADADALAEVNARDTEPDADLDDGVYEDGAPCCDAEADAEVAPDADTETVADSGAVPHSCGHALECFQGAEDIDTGLYCAVAVELCPSGEEEWLAFIWCVVSLCLSDCLETNERCEECTSDSCGDESTACWDDEC